MDFKRILKIKGLKYWVATALFVLFVVFIDQNNLLVTLRLQRQVNNLHAEERDLRAAMEQDSINAVSLVGDMNAIEHFGRENYYMKRPDEDIFVVK